MYVCTSMCYASLGRGMQIPEGIKRLKEDVWYPILSPYALFLWDRVPNCTRSWVGGHQAPATHPLPQPHSLTVLYIQVRSPIWDHLSPHPCAAKRASLNYLSAHIALFYFLFLSPLMFSRRCAWNQCLTFLPSFFIYHLYLCSSKVCT